LQEPHPAWSRRQPFAIHSEGDAAGAEGAEGSELVLHTPNPPVLCTGFEGSVQTIARNLFEFEGKDAKGCLAGAPMLTSVDESTTVPGVFLVGPTVRHGEPCLASRRVGRVTCFSRPRDS